MFNDTDILWCGMTVGPNMDAVEYAIDAIKISMRHAVFEVKWLICLDPLIETEATRKIFVCEFGERVYFTCSYDVDVTGIRSSSKAGPIHGKLLDHLITCATSDVLCIHDADVMFIKRGWDAIIRNSFAPDVAIVGPEYPSNAGLSTWLGFPMLACAAINVNIFRELNIKIDKTKVSLNKCPAAGPLDGVYVTVTSKNQKYWGRPVGYRVYMEIGYECPALIKASQYKWKTFESKQHDSFHWYYDDDGDTFATHMTQSRNRKFGCVEHKNWKKFIEKKESKS